MSQGITNVKEAIQDGDGQSKTTLGIRIRQARVVKRWNQQRLAGEAGVSQNYISDIENGKSNPAISTVTAIAKVLGVSLDYLVPDMGIDEATPQRSGRFETKEANVAARLIDELPIDERGYCIDLLTTMMAQYQKRRKENVEQMRAILTSIEHFGGREMRRLTAQELGVYGLFDDEGTPS